MTEHPIRLRNTATHSGRAEPFVPRDWQDARLPDSERRVRMYVCGPTVYDRAHLGNARPVIVFDTLFRLLRHVYGPEHVTYVRNITDVDDKIIARAAETGRPIEAITDETAQWFSEDMAALGALEPDHAPRATGHIEQMVAMIARLVELGHAYEAEGHVLFAVDTFPGYGRLANRSVDDMVAGARVEVAPYKRNPMDFVLWKPSDDGQPGSPSPRGRSQPDLPSPRGRWEPGWPSPWGRGRPGWHIECSAMSREILGGSIDIHGGGNDLMFPHHENELAQSRCAHPNEEFVRVWMHNEMLQVEGKKMSKSLGNFFTVRDLLDAGWPGEVIRFVFLSTHYRKTMDWTESRAREAMAVLRRWRSLTDGVAPSEPAPEVVAALADDLNTAGAIAAMHRLFDAGDAAALRASGELMGLLTEALGAWAGPEAAAPEVSNLIERLLADRAEARRARDFARADALRDGIAAAGVVVKDTPRGAEWELSPDFDPAKLEALR